MIEFIAAEIGYIVDSGVVICGAAASRDDPGQYHYINFQRPAETGGVEDEGVYFELDGESAAGYNIVAGCELSPGTLTIQLGEPVREGDDLVIVHFAASSSEGLGSIVEGLQRIFSGHEHLLRMVG